MEKVVKKLLMLHTSLLAVLGVFGWMILRFLFPEIEVKLYFIIPLFFYLIGVVLFWRFEKVSKSNPFKTTNLYMRIRIIKVVLSIIIVVLYWVFNKEGFRPFAMTFAAFYLIYLVWETFLFLRLEKQIKNNTPKIKQGN